jgi:hypothetical protein
MASYTKPTISNYNDNPPSNDGSTNFTDNGVDWDKNVIDEVGDPLKNYADAINNASDAAFETLDDQVIIVNIADYGDVTGADASGAIEAAIDSVSTNALLVFPDGTSSINLTTAINIDKSNITIEFPDIVWNGDYDLYPSGSSDRSVGIITVQGVQSTSVVTTVSGAITEGDSVYTFASASSFSVGDYIRLSNSDEIAYLMKVQYITGNDVTLDYVSGWDVSGGSVSVYTSTPVENVHIVVGKITDSAASATTDNAPSGVTFLHCVKCSVYIEDAVGLLYPALYTSYVTDFEVKKVHATNPRGTSSGEGYTAQISSALRANGQNITGSRVRHALDLTRAAFCTFKHIHDMDGADIGLTTHGVFSVANSGAGFGERTKRFTLRDARGHGSVHTLHAEQILFEGLKVLGNASGSIRIGPGTDMNRCTMATSGTFYYQGRMDRVPMENIVVHECVLPDATFKDFTADVIISDSSSIGWLDNDAAETGTHDGSNNAAALTDSTASWVINEHAGKVISNTTDGSTATIASNTATTITGTLSGGTDDDWDTSDAYSLPPHNPSKVHIRDSDINSLLVSTIIADTLVEITDCEISSDTTASNRGLRIAAPTIKINSGTNINSTIISAEGATVNSFSIMGTDFNTANSSMTTGMIRLNNTAGIEFSVTDINAVYTGTGKLILSDRSGNSGINQRISNNTLNGDLDINDDNSGMSKSIVVANLVKATADLPTAGAASIVADNLQI